MEKVNCIKEAEDLLVRVEDGNIGNIELQMEVTRVIPEVLDFAENQITPLDEISKIEGTYLEIINKIIKSDLSFIFTPMKNNEEGELEEFQIDMTDIDGLVKKILYKRCNGNKFEQSHTYIK